MPSLSFDQVAHAYDATRGYPDVVARQIVQAIERVANATPQTRFLEVGVGTGRIAFPLTSLGHTYTGVDISEKMVEQLQEKLRVAHWQQQSQPWGRLSDEDATQSSLVVRRYVNPEQSASLRLVMSDITNLPFRKASFDIAIAVHIFHLVDGWQRAVQEVLQALRPGGALLHCWDEHGKLDVQDISEEWQRILTALGGKSRRPGASSVYFVTEWLTNHGLQTQKIQAVSWERSVTPRQIIENITQRLWSNTWSIPDSIFVPAAERLTTWANERYRTDIDIPRIQDCRFVISKTVV
ncbi:MAG: class I SAM-dependent methyltransferase [Ktedonobacteraceae bacterium]